MVNLEMGIISRRHFISNELTSRCLPTPSMPTPSTSEKDSTNTQLLYTGDRRLSSCVCTSRQNAAMEADSAGPDRPFICEYCPKKYLRKNNLEDHILMEHPDTSQVGCSVFQKFHLYFSPYKSIMW